MTGDSTPLPALRPTETSPDGPRAVSDPEFTARALHDAIHGLSDRSPELSAAVAFVPWQRWAGLLSLAAVIVVAVLAPIGTATVLVALCTVVYVATMVDRLLLFRRGLNSDAIMTVTDAQARAIADEDLPEYTVLVPAYDETEVIGQLITAMGALEYPPEKLQVLLLLEADDERTIAAAEDAGISRIEDAARDEVITVLTVPPADPRTKPKACNYGLHFATGEIITIYDAEDIPDPLQLRRVVAAFDRLGPETACIQAKLAYDNGPQNLLTAWFTAEYAVWFSFFLPGLMRSDAPIPLGGTSNHIRREVLDRIGAWDGYNVTEDADLGVRIAASGLRTAVVESVTIEEANSDPINWVRQRSRWYKGYLQTWLVHVRDPLRILRVLGPRATLRFTLFIAGTPVTAVINLVFWFVLASWILGQPAVIAEMFPAYVYFPAMVSLVLGNSAAVYINLVGCRETGNENLVLANLLVPLYWVLMAVAATKAAWQLIRDPSYWEKTFHGLPGSEGTTEM